MIVPWRRNVYPSHLLDDALSALTAADWGAADAPVAWMHWPVDHSNPYQRLIYSRFPERNLIPIRLSRLGDIDGLLRALPAQVVRVLHVHWLYEVTQGSTSEADALARVEAFEADIRRLVGQGVRLFWTVHNVLPHETVYPAVETRLRRFMLQAAEVVHVMHGSHVDLLRSAFGVEPRAVVDAAHPTFAGAYPDWADRATARAWLGIPQGARVLVTFGQVRPYKGHNQFLDAFDLAARRDPALRWLVAGKIRDEAGADEFGRRATDHPAVLLYPGFVPESDVQFYLRAADAAVYPYISSLNSGALALTAGFGLPAYVSTGTSVAGLMPDEAVVRFDLTDTEATARLLTQPHPAVSEAGRRAVRAHVVDFTPAAVSRRFAEAAREQLDDRVSLPTVG
ncbi:MAG TPA: glycosyltransferase [Micromonospora sp.]